MLDWLLQQTVNGLALGAIYALIALGYTMVYGILRFINFAHSDVLMLGAFSAYYLQRALAPRLGAASWTTALLVFLGAALLCAALGMLIEFLAYRPLRRQPRLTVLITAIGVSLLIEFTTQNEKVFGAATKPFETLLPVPDFVLGHIYLAGNDLVILGVTLALLLGMWLIVQKTRMGLAMRAVAFNEQAAALMGVNVNRVISFTFALGSALAAVAGIFYAMRSRGIEPLMGIQPGLRAFIAAVLGGIGNLPGAALGGLLLGLLETYAGGVTWLSKYRDGFAFAMLILILLFRPAGLLGKVQTEKV